MLDIISATAMLDRACTCMVSVLCLSDSYLGQLEKEKLGTGNGMGIETGATQY